MTYVDIEKAIQLMQQAGNSRIPIPLSVARQLIDKARAWDRAPAIIKDAARELEAAQ